MKAGSEDKPFEGKTYPTYFKFKGKDYGYDLNRETHINMRCRIAFETDVVNDYLSRSIDPGTFTLFVLNCGERREAKDAGFASNVNLQNGIASLSVKFPESCKVADKLQFVAVVNDSTLLDPFENKFSIVLQKATESSGGNGDRQKSPKDESGDDREMPGGIEIPKPIPVHQEDWERVGFDQFTALRIKDTGERGASATGKQDVVVYDFFINVDNVHLKRFLKTELKLGEGDKVARTRFELGMMLVTLALIHQDKINQKTDDTQNASGEIVQAESLEDRVANVTKALAPFLLPMIGALGALDEEQVAAGSASGEAT